MNRKETEQALLAEIERHPGVAYRFEQRGRHPSIVLTYQNRERFLVYSSTPCERRAVLNQITQLRRTIRELRL